MYFSIAAIRSGTEWKTPRLMALSVSSRNHRSTRFSQDDAVGVNCSWKRGCLVSQVFTSLCLWVGVAVQNQMNRKPFGHFPIYRAQEPQELLLAMAVHALADHGAIEGIEGGEQRGGAVPLVVGEGCPADRPRVIGSEA
jgi:hypothetical protein